MASLSILSANVVPYSTPIIFSGNLPTNPVRCFCLFEGSFTAAFKETGPSPKAYPICHGNMYAGGTPISVANICLRDICSKLAIFKMNAIFSTQPQTLPETKPMECFHCGLYHQHSIIQAIRLFQSWLRQPFSYNEHILQGC